MKTQNGCYNRNKKIIEAINLIICLIIWLYYLLLFLKQPFTLLHHKKNIYYVSQKYFYFFYLIFFSQNRFYYAIKRFWEQVITAQLLLYLEGSNLLISQVFIFLSYSFNNNLYSIEQTLMESLEGHQIKLLSTT